MSDYTSYYTEQLGEAEKQIWNDAAILFEELLNELNSKNLLRRGTLRMDRERLMLIWQNSRSYGLALNEMIHKFDSEEALKEFASSSGLTLDVITYIFMSQLIGTALIDFESVLKTSLLFFLEEESGIKRTMTLGKLLNQIKKISPDIGERLIKMVNTDVRNALAHGTFWFKEGGKVFLATNSYLDEAKEVELYQFWIEIKRINIISHAFVNVLHQKMVAGYLRI